MEAAAANERAKIVHLRKDLQARVKCTKTVMGLNTTTGWLFKKPGPYGATNLKRRKPPFQRPSVRTLLHRSLHCTTLHGEHAKYMSELEEWALEVENRSQQDFLSDHLAVLHHAPPSLKEDLHSSHNILLGNSSSPLQSIPSARVSQAQG